MNLGILLDLPATVAPDQPILSDGERTLSLGELREATAKRGAALDRLGIHRGDRVGIFAVNSIAVVELIYAVTARGAIAVPMNFRARAPEAEHMIKNSGVQVVFADSRYATVLDSVVNGTQVPIEFIDRETAEPVSATSAEFVVDMTVDDDEVAILIYTSGTTAMPKGVPLTHAGLSSFALAGGDVADGTEHGRTLLTVPLYHVAGLGTLLLSIYGGRRVELMPQFEERAWLERVERAGITHAFLVPTMLSKILSHPDSERFDLASLRAIGYGAAPMPQSVIRRAIARFPHVAFSGAYGMSETTSTVTVLGEDDHRVDLDAPEDDEKLRRLGSVGTAVSGVEIAIADHQGGIATTPGEVGEVLVRTGRAMRGYWDRASTSGKGSHDAEGWLRTGDLGYLDQDGYLFLVGRDSDMIIRGGENIAPLEIEDVLCFHPDVVEAAVIGVEDEEWGERIEAAVVLSGDSTLTEGELEALCADLASHKRPERFVVVPELPRTSTGKLMRREVVKMLSQSRANA